MSDFLIKKVERGYLILEYWGENRGLASRMWAFSTLEEVQGYLPELFKQQGESK